MYYIKEILNSNTNIENSKHILMKRDINCNLKIKSLKNIYIFRIKNL